MKKIYLTIIILLALIVNVKSVEARKEYDTTWQDSETWDKTCIYGGTGGEVTVYIKPGKSKIVHTLEDGKVISTPNGGTDSDVNDENTMLYYKYIRTNGIVVKDNKCPVIIYVFFIKSDLGFNEYTNRYETIYDIDYSMTDNGGDPYVLKGNSGGMSDIDNSGEETCEGVINTKARNLINKYLGYIHIIVPIMVLALGVFDFFKAAISSKEEEMKKAQNRFIIRLVAGVLVFLAPTIVNIIISILNNGACPIN